MKAKTMTFGSQSRLEIRLPCLLTVALKAAFSDWRRAGLVLDGVTAREDPVNIHWFSPVSKSTTGVRGQSTADYGRFMNKLKPSVELRDRDNIIPVPLVWTTAGFSKGRGGKLTQRCVTLLTEWPMVEQYRSARHGTRCPRVICVQQAARS